MSATERILVRVSDGEMRRRWQAARDAMAEAGIDALVMQSTNDWLGGTVRWFTDMPAHNGYPRSVVFHAGDWMSVVEMGPFDGTRRLDGSDPVHRGVGEMRFTPSFASIAYTNGYDGALVADMVGRRGYRRVGIVGESGLPVGFMAPIRAACERRTELVDATLLVDRLKAIKSAEEIGFIRRTAAMQDAVFAAVLAGIRPGMRDCDVTALAWHEGQRLGSEQGILLGASAPVGVRSSFLGRHLQGRMLQPGDHLSLLIELNGPGGFYTELGRTIVLGRASTELVEASAAMREAQEASLKRLTPGAPAAAIAAAHDDFMRGRGLPLERRLYSHGQGHDMVERPLIRFDETMSIAAGMSMVVHPGYESEALFSVVCDNYVIGADGPGECLHSTEKKVFEV
jgi:Xaa-Pro aminopeptidase